MTDTHTELNFLTQLGVLYRSARDEKRARRDAWIRNYKLVNNRLGNVQAQSWQPSPRSSEIYPTLSSTVGWMTDQNINIDISPAADPSSDFFQLQSKICNDLRAVLISNYITESEDTQVKLAVWDGLIYGTGLLKNVWDNALAGGYGNAVSRRVDPFSFYPDPAATSLADAEYFVEARLMSLAEIERRWPDSYLELEANLSAGASELDEKPTYTSEAGGQLKTNPGLLPTSGTYGNLGSSAVGRFGGHAKNYTFTPLPPIPVYEYWLRENQPWYDSDTKYVMDRWRVVVVASNVILLDEYADELWSYASHPYERFVFDDIGEFYGISLVDHLAHPQVYINRLLTAIENNAELTGNPIFLEPTNSGIGRATIVNRPGARFILNSQAASQQNRPTWMTPPNMPTQVMELIQFWESRIESISGLAASVKGQTPGKGGQRQAEGTLSTIQESAFVRIRSAQRNLEKCLEGCAKKKADLVIDNYTEPRIISSIGPGGQSTALALNARHFLVPGPNKAQPLEYSLTIQAGAQAPTSRQARIAEADKLFAMGAIDDQSVLEAHQYPNIQDLLKRKLAKMQAGIHAPPGARQRTQRSV